MLASMIYVVSMDNKGDIKYVGKVISKVCDSSTMVLIVPKKVIIITLTPFVENMKRQEVSKD